MRTENSSPVNVWLKRLCIMFLLCWKVYVLMTLVVNLRNEDLHGGVYMRFSGSVSSRVTSSVLK